MSEQLSLLHSYLAWPLAICIAWIAGEIGKRWLYLPRISCYGLIGLVLSNGPFKLLDEATNAQVAILVDFAFALILFELGYRINLRWLRTNKWIGLTSLIEAACTFVSVYFAAQFFDVAKLDAALLAALAMSTSPAAIVRVVNQFKSSGQVTERLLHLTAFNCVLALATFKIVLGYSVYSSVGNLYYAISSSVWILVVSAALGAVFGVIAPSILRRLGNVERNATIAFALAALLLTALTHTFKYSPVVAALVFGMVARHRRVILPQAQQNFGVLGDLLSLLLFVFVSASLRWEDIISGLGFALVIIVIRLLAKTLSVTALARWGGITWRKGMLTGLALTPMSVFVILLLERIRHLPISSAGSIAGMAAIVLMLEVIGPIVSQRALVWAGETHREGGR